MSDHFTPEQIARDREINGKATPGNWAIEQTVHGGESYGITGVQTDHEDGVENAPGSYSQTICVIPHGLRTFRNPPVANMRFIANARTRFPLALDEIEKLQNVVISLRKRIHLTEKHNQYFERCESGWCNPVGTIACGTINDEAAKEPQCGDPFAISVAIEVKKQTDDLCAEIGRMPAENAAMSEALAEVSREANSYGCNHEDQQDEESGLCGGDDCKRCYLLAITRTSHDAVAALDILTQITEWAAEALNTPTDGNGSIQKGQRKP